MAKAKTIRLSCQTANHESLSSLRPFQGKFKGIGEEDKAKLKKQILQLGICSPFAVWVNEGKSCVLDGHQRLQVLKEMLADKEGELGPINGVEEAVPVIYVHPKDADEAVRMVLGLASTYGRVNSNGLRKFAKAAGISDKDVQACFSFPELDLKESEQGEEGEEKKKVEFEAGAGKKQMVKCPECEKVFNAKTNKAPKD